MAGFQSSHTIVLPFRPLSHGLELKDGTRRGSLLPPFHLPAPQCRDPPQLCQSRLFADTEIIWNYPSSFWCNWVQQPLSHPPSCSFPPSLALDLSLHSVQLNLNHNICSPPTRLKSQEKALGTQQNQILSNHLAWTPRQRKLQRYPDVMALEVASVLLTGYKGQVRLRDRQ